MIFPLFRTVGGRFSVRSTPIGSYQAVAGDLTRFGGRGAVREAVDPFTRGPGKLLGGAGAVSWLKLKQARRLVRYYISFEID